MLYIQRSDIKDNEISNTLQKTSFDIAKKYTRSEANPGDIIFSLRGNLAETAIVPNSLKDVNLARGVARISLKDDFDIPYVKFVLESNRVLAKMVAVSQGSTFKEISLETLRKVKIPIPNSKEKQKSIGEYFRNY